MRCYTYNVEMIVHVFASTEDEASDKLDSSGGQISMRSTKLLDAVTVSLDKDAAEDSK
jgi:hypothetical protein